MAFQGNCKKHVIFGKTGSGKTYLAERIVDRLECSRVVYYDSNGHDYSDGVIIESLDQFKSYIRRVKDSSFRIVYRSINPRADFETICQIIQAAGNIIFVVDECDMYFKDSEPGEAFGDLIRRGRHDNIELIGITQRPRQMGEIRSMANMLYVFETHEQSDLAYFRSSFSEKLIELIKQLKEYEYVCVPLPYDESQLRIYKENNERIRTISAEVDQQPEPGEPVGLQSVDGDPNLPDQ